MIRNAHRITGLMIGVSFALVAASNAAASQPDPGKKACAKEARVLCPSEMKSLSRKKVEACMVKNVDKVSPTCKEAMYEIKRMREEKGKT